MKITTITIDGEPARAGQKSRCFSVQLLAYVLADDLWEFGSGAKDRTLRPVLLACAGTQQVSRAFFANLRQGRCAIPSDSRIASRIEIPKSAGFRYETHSAAEATLTLAYLPSVFSLQPPSPDAASIAFVCLPPAWWVDEQCRVLAASHTPSEAREAAIAAYFAAFLDQRSTLPMVGDINFHLQLYRAALQEPWCNAPGSEPFMPVGLQSIGFDTAIYCNVDHETFSQFLATQTAAYFGSKKETCSYGSPILRCTGRLLPDTASHPAQLGLTA